MKTSWDEKLEEARQNLLQALSEHEKYLDLVKSEIKRVLDSKRDEDFLGDPALLKELFAQSWGETWAYDRVHKLCTTNMETVVVTGIDSREEYFSHPILQLRLNYKQNVDAEVVCIKAWLKNFALGRRSIVIDVMDWELSQYQSYHVKYNIQTKVAQVISSVQGKILSGDLHKAVKWIADNRPYRGLYGDEDYE